jgi:transposase-like protein
MSAFDPLRTLPASPFRYFNSSPEVIRLAVLLYVKYPLSLRNVEDLLHERGIDLSHETVAPPGIRTAVLHNADWGDFRTGC